MKRRLFVSLVTALPLSALLAAPASAQQTGLDPAPNPNSATLEVDFMMGMIPHHRSAIMMAQMAVQKSPRPEIRDLAQTIIDSQQGEINELSTWLRTWYGLEPPTATQMPMSDMQEMAPMAHGTMPDMAARMQNLQTLSGAAFDVEFMSAMSDHHAMAISMAAPVLMGGHHADLYRMAEDMVIMQAQEIKQMRDYLNRFYGVKRPLEGPLMPLPAGS